MVEVSAAVVLEAIWRASVYSAAHSLCAIVARVGVYMVHMGKVRGIGGMGASSAAVSATGCVNRMMGAQIESGAPTPPRWTDKCWLSGSHVQPLGSV